MDLRPGLGWFLLIAYFGGCVAVGRARCSGATHSFGHPVLMATGALLVQRGQHLGSNREGSAGHDVATPACWFIHHIGIGGQRSSDFTGHLGSFVAG